MRKVILEIIAFGWQFLYVPLRVSCYITTIFYIFACKDDCGIVVKRSGYAEAFIYKGYGDRQCCYSACQSDISEVA